MLRKKFHFIREKARKYFCLILGLPTRAYLRDFRSENIFTITDLFQLVIDDRVNWPLSFRILQRFFYTCIQLYMSEYIRKSDISRGYQLSVWTSRVWHAEYLSVHVPRLIPLMPSGASNICCPRDCVSRHNGGTSGAPLKPLRVDSALRALSTLRGLRRRSLSDSKCWTQRWA